ncbi:hypothetical protein [Amycolatopsis saalfeldensis]|uniref:Uncharacterized protein n=1 Tax=Amycolatopsis saalfeldensis TaxID=394193 RepID=A0A1H8XL42_9PSEU|nr:hypothetical protein [Amycolatopsis saalfeldensis]SEP40814.1 hypothetical protein SAMN04489732_10851 [Amycolatopsis saalfeldensis]
MTTALETRYRRLLRVLPAYYRNRWEDDMVATFLETTDRTSEDPEFDHEYGRPGLAEATSVLSLAVRLRIGEGTEGRPRRYVIASDVVRRFALVSATFQASLALIQGILRLTWPPDLVRTPPTLTLITALLWLPAFLALMAGSRTWATTFSALATVGTVVRLFDFPTLTLVGTLVLQLTTIAAVAAISHPNTVHIGRWLPGLAGAAILVFTIQWAFILPTAGIAGILTVLAAPALASRNCVRPGSPRPRSPWWPACFPFRRWSIRRWVSTWADPHSPDLGDETESGVDAAGPPGRGGEVGQ